jgi:hypothetical protein
MPYSFNPFTGNFDFSEKAGNSTENSNLIETSENLITNNDILTTGKIAFEEDTALVKFGNNVTYQKTLYPFGYCYPSITGNSDSLDTYSTLSVHNDIIVFCKDSSGNIGIWALKTGTSENNLNKIQRPQDYQAGVNEKYWEYVIVGVGVDTTPPPVEHPIQQTPSNVLTVDASATGNNTGTSWQNAFVNLQDAIDAAKLSVGKKIWVKVGTHYPTSNHSWNVGNNRYKHFKIANNIPIYGGFAGWEGALEERDVINNKTYLSNALDNNYHILRHADTSYLNKDLTLLDGFIFTGTADTRSDGSGDESTGAGIFLSYNHGLTLKNCIFQNLKCNNIGSAININASCNLILDNCEFSFCEATNGGAGIKSYQGTIVATNCLFSNNKVTATIANSGGAAINCEASTVSQGITLTNCIFRNNLCSLTSAVDGIGGGAIRCKIDPGIARLTNCLFEGNEGYYAGACYIYCGGNQTNIDNSICEVTSCNFYTNTSRYGILFISSLNGIVDRCVLRENYINQSATLYIRYAKPKIYNSLIYGNKSDLYSAGIYVNAVVSGAEIKNVTVTSNYSTYGAGLGLIGSSVLNVYNSIFWGNIASTNGNEILVDNSTLNTFNCCFRNSTTNGITDVRVQGTGVHNQNSNITGDPLFISYTTPTPLTNPHKSGDYNLTQSSPCRDSGLNINTYGSLDLNNATRIVNVVDMGCYEYQ